MARCSAPVNPRCTADAVTHGLCNSHRMQLQRFGSIEKLKPIRRQGAGGGRLGPVDVTKECERIFHELAAEAGTNVHAYLKDLLEKHAKRARNSKT